ncbi:MAG: PAS domain S-box protein [Myxococcota bacterium]
MSIVPPTDQNPGSRSVPRAGALAEVTTLLGLMPHATLVVDGAGRVAALNDEAAKVFGYSADELVGQPFDVLVPEQYRASHAQHHRHFQAVPESRDMGHRRELPARHRDGTTLVVQIGLRALDVDEGRVVLVSIHDVSKRRAAEDALRASEARFRHLVESLPHMVWTASGDGRPGHMSARLVEYTGAPPRDEPGLPHLVGVVHPDDRAALVLAWQEVAHSQRELRLEHRLRRHDGTYRWFETRAVPTGEGAAASWVGSCTDIHENRALRDSLRQEETKLRRIAAMTPLILYSFQMRPDGRVRFPYASTALHDLTGLWPEEVTEDGSQVLGMIDRADIDRVVASIAASAHGMTPWHEEFRVHSPTRGDRWIEGMSMPVREADGSTTWFGVMSDNSARKLMEQALRESQERFARAFDASPIGMALVRLGDQAIVETNRALERIVRRSREDVRSRPYSSLGFTPLAESQADVRARFEASGRLSAVGYSFPRPDGTLGEAFLWAERLEIGGQDFALTLIEDVTEQRRTDERFRQLAETIREVFWLADGEARRFEYVSPAFESIWGRPAAGLYLSRDAWLDTLHAEDRARVRSLTAAQWDDGFDVEYRIVRPDGSVRWIRDQAFPVRDAAGRVARVAGLTEDVTERRRLEEQLRQTQKLESIGLLAGGIAHDFNNWLTVVAGCSELLLMGLPPGDSETRELLEEIRSAGDGAAALTRQLLAFSRKQVHEPRQIDIVAIVTETERMLRRLLGEDVYLETRLASKGVVEADPGTVTQVLVNLAVNARDAMPNGGKLLIETRDIVIGSGEERGKLHAGRWLELSMTDTGHGMPPDVVSRIFEPFFTTKPMGRGTGLGLSVVHGIIDQSRGHIEVGSVPGVGTTFTMYFPIVDDRLRTRPAQRVTESRGSETLLLVEDEALVRRVAERELRRSGFDVLVASDAEEALAIVRARPDVAMMVTDVVMPGLDGRQLCEAARRLRPELPVLYTSGYTDDAVVRRGVLSEEVAFLAKPYTPEALVAKVRAVLDKR